MLELKHLCFGVTDEAGTTEILRDLSLTLDPGKLLVITGPNGGGKSTLARMIMGIGQPDSGQILFEGQDITALDISQRARLGIGYAFQHPPRFKGLTVHRLMSLAHGGPLSAQECCGYLTQVGLCAADYLDREVDGSLSGGELKRIEIATLMARRLKLAIYDEPEAGIDLWSFQMLVDSFRAMHGDPRMGIIIISHQERIIEMADLIAVVADGQVRELGPRAAILPRLMGEFSDRCAMGRQYAKEERRHG